MDSHRSGLAGYELTESRNGGGVATGLPESGAIIKYCISVLEVWSDKWKTPWLAKAVKLDFSTRLTKSLGRCTPFSKEIRLSRELIHRDKRALLLEVLCHEAAHIINYAHHGRLVKPHGEEWQTLVKIIGYQPHRKIPIKQIEEIPRPSNPSTVYEHRCPVCQNVRYSKKPIKRWRCGVCLANGLPGDLVITKHTKKSGDQNES